ncbi:bifunctional glutamate N-acetyltransferase/amino-acid acetyltransferase ArgJ [Kordiimonas pumila]|uniref:Arginine biosynthesis bifunctional protein ArgJ n=1 Tax=Kordiimonas pumila TaxID=2161677 RepID=A0ABV7D113_9PROT|nr:bifunctional glutamate N-acetyltransferase/amino-acid acetyltransferase ArgJ [Kordiimonas pumila]
MAKLPVSPLAPFEFPSIQPVPGVEFGTVCTGIRYKERPDLLMVVFPENTVAAGVFTRSKAPAAPVDWSRAALAATGGKARCLLVNAGNANAFTGKKGDEAALSSAEMAAEVVGCSTSEVLLASTGVIGQPLNVSSFKKFLPIINSGLSGVLWKDAAAAISTTDTFPKGCCKVAEIDGQQVIISGIAKGSGMIAPDMATMLGFVFTDAPVSSECLQAILSEATEKSFNATTVDGDTSTNDTVMAFATGVKGTIITDPADPKLAGFKAQFTALMIDLAQQVVRDGEGATKFITITVEGAEDAAAAKKIALTIANSPLVKTAIAGEDANWGRIVMAVGKSGEAADRDKLQIWIGGQHVAKDGMVLPSYSEEQASAHMKEQEIDIRVHVGIADGTATVWTCDLTHGYISINADYRS